MAETQTTTTKKDPFAGVSNDQISELLQRNQAKLRELPEFKAPGTREEAVSLLVAAGIEPDEAPPTTEQLAEGSRFEISTPAPGFSGDRFGVRFNNGKGYTDDNKAADACESCGYAVTDRRAAKKK